MLLAEVRYQKNGAFVRTLMFLQDENGAVIGISVKNAGETSFTSYYYAKNLQGDVVAVYRSDYNSTTQTYYPTLVASYEYDAWGKVTRVKGSSGTVLSLEAYPNHIAHVNPIRYRGYYYDNETGFYYLQSRYYDPVISRFINADSYGSTGQGFLGCNMFAYCGNNPICFSDPTGHAFILALIGTVVFTGLLLSGCSKQSNSIMHDVPLYFQGYDRDLCWAYCQVMAEEYVANYYKKPIKTQAEADARALEIAIAVNGEEAWNGSGYPQNYRDMVYISTIDELYSYLHAGPVYASYVNPTAQEGEPSGHLVVVTGVDLDTGMVYTNNPWGIQGAQTFDEFLTCHTGGDLSMPFEGIVRMYYWEGR